MALKLELPASDTAFYELHYSNGDHGGEPCKGLDKAIACAARLLRQGNSSLSIHIIDMRQPERNLHYAILSLKREAEGVRIRIGRSNPDIRTLDRCSPGDIIEYEHNEYLVTRKIHYKDYNGPDVMDAVRLLDGEPRQIKGDEKVSRISIGRHE